VSLTVLGVVIVSLIAFVLTETVSPRPMFDVSVFRVLVFRRDRRLGGDGHQLLPFMIYLPVGFQAGLGHSSVNACLALPAYTQMSLRYRSGMAT